MYAVIDTNVIVASLKTRACVKVNLCVTDF